MPLQKERENIMTDSKCEVYIPVYIPARMSIYRVKASELQQKLDKLRRNKDVLMRFFFVLSEEQEKHVRDALG